MKNNIAITVDNISKQFLLPHQRKQSVKSMFTSILHIGNERPDIQKALHDISFAINKGEFFGIVGRNGSGKSTLLKILAGIYQPTTGSVRKTGKLVPFIELGVGFNPELTGRENIYLNGAMLGFSVKEVTEMYQDIVEFAELERFMDQKLKNYSSGMQVRLAFSMATRAKADILLVDEVLAVGDADFQRKCFDYFRKLKKSDTTIIFVTHDMNAVKTFCDRAVLIEDGVITSEGQAQDVAEDYLRLFSSNSVVALKQTKKRWGSGDIVIKDAELVINNASIKIIIDLQSAYHDIEEFVVGYYFENSEGDTVMGGNNLNAPIGATKLTFSNNSKKRLIFETPNFLGTGEYKLSIIVRDINSTIFDKWIGVTGFKVTKSESYYPTIAQATLITEEL